MRQLGYAVALLVAAATPSFAGSMLYATAAREQRIDAFCLKDGKLPGSPKASVQTAAIEPRRLLVAENVVTGTADPDMTGDVLYVALADRIQAFRILRNGGLKDLGFSKKVDFMDPRDMVVSADKHRLYVAQRGFNRIVAYDIDPSSGALSEEFSSCAIGRNGSRFVTLAGPTVASATSSAIGAFLYAASEVNGRLDVYALDQSGNILELDDGKSTTTSTTVAGSPTTTTTSTTLPEACTTQRPTVVGVSTNCKNIDGDRPPATVSYASRRGLANPKSVALDGDMLYVEERAHRRLTQFRLSDGVFCDSYPPLVLPDSCPSPIVQCPTFNPLAGDRCLERQQRRIDKNRDLRQCPASRTRGFVQYEDVVLFGNTLLGTQFFRGRIDSYRLGESDEDPLAVPKPLELPKNPKRLSDVDVRMTPVRSLARSLPALRGECSDTDPTRPCACAATRSCAGILYVAAGAFDRVVAYSLDQGGLLTKDGASAPVPFSRTDALKDSFPNDVAVAVFPGDCN